ncbi:MAG: APC family permease [Microbacteriaceae bacterium]|nr:APC family permease [Microbacteriaceae bacterium]
MTTDTLDAVDHSGGLARRSLTPIEVTAQSVANVAPSAVIAFAPAQMAASAGNGAWFSFLIGTGIALVVAYSVVVFARRRAGVGSLYSLVRPALGPTGSFITGWALLIGVIAIAAGSLCGVGFFVAQTLDQFGVTLFDGILGQIVIDLVMLALALYLMITSVRISARVSAVLELLSITVIVITLVIIFVKSGKFIDGAQLSLTGATFSGIAFAIVLAILGFVGFESAASLGQESNDPFRAIPRAVTRSAILAGILYIFATYAQVAQFKGGAAALAASGSPMDDLTKQWGLSFLQPVLDIGFSASFFAVVVACITVGARILFGMSNEGLLPVWLGHAHPVHRTPAKAIWLMVGIVAVPAVVVIALGTAPLAATGYIDTVGVFGYMVSYAAVCIGAPLFLRHLGVRQIALATTLGIVGTVALAYVFYTNVFPVPAYPLNTLPYWFLATMVVGLVGFAVLRSRRPQVAAQAGSFADDA